MGVLLASAQRSACCQVRPTQALSPAGARATGRQVQTAAVRVERSVAVIGVVVAADRPRSSWLVKHLWSLAVAAVAAQPTLQAPPEPAAMLG